MPYGSYVRPHDAGSGGGGTGGGRGGGVIELKVGSALHLDGEIVARGADASGGDGGGGSGGSIFITAMNFSGHGNVSVEGGRGRGAGYGGSGGRMAVKVIWQRDFAGLYKAFGGVGGAKHADKSVGNAAAGTVYYTSSGSLTGREFVNTSAGPAYKDDRRSLVVDNVRRTSTLATALARDDAAVDTFQLDTVDILHDALLQMVPPDGRLTVHRLRGDRSGRLHLLAGQRAYVEYVPSEVGYTVAPVSYVVDPDAELVLPSTVILIGTQTVIRGLLTNVHNLSVAQGSQVNFAHNHNIPVSFRLCQGMIIKCLHLKLFKISDNIE